jgi:hypothetical protein
VKESKRATLLSLIALAFACAGALGVARADTRDLRVISARAGGVNLVAGDVKVRRVASADWLALSAADELRGGDTVRTGANGRVEVLLNPGSYFRAGGDTEFTLVSADLNELRVELARGSAVVEATGYGDMNLSIEVAVPGGLVRVVRSGVYRFNAPAGAPSEVAVQKGRAVIGVTIVKGGKVARLSDGAVEVVKQDKKLRDDLDQWSRERGKELAKANEKLSRRTVRSALTMGSFDNIFDAQRSFGGYWFFNADIRCYTFLPYGWGWRSPYGYGYNTAAYWPVRGPIGGWNPNNQPSGGGADGGGSGGSGSSGGGWGRGGSTPTSSAPVSPPSRAEPMERPMRERSIEPGARP